MNTGLSPETGPVLWTGLCLDFWSEVGKVTLKSNSDEVLSDEFLLKSNGDEVLNDDFSLKSNGNGAFIAD